MDKMTFASYKFKPSDVIEGLNRYFAETKANRYRRVPLEIRRGVCYNNPDCVKDITFTNSRPEGATKDGWRCWNHYLICDPEEVVGVAINWLREKYDIFYTPGMEATREDFDVDEAAKEYEKATQTSDIFCEEKLDMVPVAKVREALGIAEDSDIFEAIRVLKKSDERAHSEMYNARGEKYELLKQVREILNLNPEVNLFDALRHARGDIDSATRLRLESSELSHRNRELCRRLADIRKAAGMSDLNPTDLVEYIRDLAKSRREALDRWYDEHSTVLDMKDDILKVYREIFDCSNGDPEGSDEETLQDILTEYKRTLALKDAAEEKTIKYKELARENEEKLSDDSTRLDRYARFRSNVCTALCLGGETSDADILDTIAKMRDEINKRIVFRNDVAKAIGLTWTDSNSDIIKRAMQTKECHDKLYKDYAELRKAIWDAMGKKTETQPGDNASLVGEVQTLVYGNKWLSEFRNSVAEAIGMDYPTTNTFIVKHVADIYKDWGELHDLVPNLRGEVQDLQNKYDDAESRFRFQSGLRQMWHARWESENERANGVQKALDREREKCRVKDISLETAKKQYEKVCGNLETAECALNGMKSKVRSLREEKTKVISALGQDIWDDCLK